MLSSRPTCLTRNTWSVRARLMEISLSFVSQNQYLHDVNIFLYKHGLPGGSHAKIPHQKHEFFTVCVCKLMLYGLSFKVCIGTEQHFC